MDHYQTLGISKTASLDEIKKAYRKLASQHHPDKGGDTATFQKVEEAYRILSDPQKKQEYDNPSRPFPFQDFGQPGGFSFNFNGFDINDLFGQMFNQQGQHRHNQSFRTSIWVTLEQVYNGGDQVLRVQTNAGVQFLNVKIPKGIQDGSHVRYDNLIPNSSLIVEFRISPHLKFERRMNDLYCNHSISVLDLIVGSKFSFTTISGKTFEVVVPPKTQPYMHLKIQGQGLPVLNSDQYGDQIILLKPFIPDIIDSSITDSILNSKNR